MRMVIIKSIVSLDPWKKLLEEVAPNTWKFDIARNVGEYYSPTPSEGYEEKFVLGNFPGGGGSTTEAFEWARSKKYLLTNPRETLSLLKGEDLRKELGVSMLTLVSTTDYTHNKVQQFFYVNLDSEECRASLGKPTDFGLQTDWFLFKKKQSFWRKVKRVISALKKVKD